MIDKTAVEKLLTKAQQYPALAHTYATELDRLFRAAGKKPVTFSANAWSKESMETVQRVGLHTKFADVVEITDSKVMLTAEALIKKGKRGDAFAHVFTRASGRQVNALNLFYANHASPSPSTRLHYLNKYLSSYGLGLTLKEDASADFFQRITSTDNAAKVDGPLVTVIMPAHNAENTIELALGSLLNQTWRNLQIIVVDDASTDGTLQKAKELAKRDPRVEVLNSPVNVGPYVCRNLGVLHARGQWLTVHDADDWAFPNRIEQQVQALISANALACTGSSLRMNEQGQINSPIDSACTSEDGYLRLCFVSLMIQTAYFHNELGAWDSVRVAGDAELIERLNVLGTPNIHLHRPLMLCLDHEAGLTNHQEFGLYNEAGKFKPLRFEYKKAFTTWHKIEGSKKIKAFSDDRPFFAPARLLSPKLDLDKIFSFSTTRPINKENSDQKLSHSVSKNSNQDDLVLILIPAFNSERTIEESVKSIISQEYKNIRILVIDDASTDKTYEKSLALKKVDARVSVIRNKTNVGAFSSVNIGLYQCRWEKFDYFIKHDADDLMLPNKICSQVTALKESPHAVFCTTGYSRIDHATKEVISGKNRGHNMTLYHINVFRKLGYFDETRFGGDSEYLERAILAYGEGAEIHLNERLTNAYILPSSLTSNNPLGSERRQNYQTKFKFEHEIMLQKQFFYKNSKCQSNMNHFIRAKNTVICGVATLFDRRDALRDTVKSILPQVDKLIVYQNDYYEIFDFLYHDKIEVISAKSTNIDMGDAGKFYRVQDFDDVI
jgi:glycosyltransferase involved in cell wall biosynthesis